MRKRQTRNCKFTGKGQRPRWMAGGPTVSGVRDDVPRERKDFLKG